jgi:ABC-type thiamine transport system ATPase subunit
VGERGLKLCGGEKQRVAIARCVKGFQRGLGFRVFTTIEHSGEEARAETECKGKQRVAIARCDVHTQQR